MVITTQTAIGVKIVVFPVTDIPVLGDVTVVISPSVKDTEKLFVGRGAAVTLALVL